VVQLYGADDQLLIRNVSRYFLEGLRRGDGLVMIATGDHGDAIVRQLHEETSDASQALRDGRMVVLDARTTLDCFLVDGQPDQQRFRSVVNGVLQDVRAKAATGQVRAFGEMVGLLWVDGRQPEALLLEQYWNELLAGSAYSLFCAYPIDFFDSGSHAAGLGGVLGAHTHTYAGPRTMLSGPRAAR
jgi:MEDS: MEthanogen/methylotroph, DcmR Sensory domain